VPQFPFPKGETEPARPEQSLGERRAAPGAVSLPGLQREWAFRDITGSEGAGKELTSRGRRGLRPV